MPLGSEGEDDGTGEEFCARAEDRRRVFDTYAPNHMRLAAGPRRGEGGTDAATSTEDAATDATGDVSVARRILLASSMRSEGKSLILFNAEGASGWRAM